MLLLNLFKIFIAGLLHKNESRKLVDQLAAEDTMTEISFVPAFSDNYIWILKTREYAVVVDPGDAKPVLQYLKKRQLELYAILITHHHRDHVGGVD